MVCAISTIILSLSKLLLSTAARHNRAHILSKWRRAASANGEQLPRSELVASSALQIQA